MNWPEIQKDHCCEVSSSFILCNNCKPFLNRIVTCDKKSIVYDNWWWPAQWLDWEEAPKHFPKTNLHPKRSWSLFGGLLSVWSTTAFWIPRKPLHLRSMLNRSMRYTKNYNISSHHLSIERASSSPWQCLTTGHTTNASKIEWIWLQSFASSSIFTWPFTNWHLDNFLQGECFYNQQDAENVF